MGRLVRSTRWIAAGSAALFAVPVLADLLLNGWTRAFRYLAADAFLYLAVARNLGELGFPTLDQIHPTNGFHPLWQLGVAGLYGLTRELGLAESRLPVAVLLANVALIGGAVATLCNGDARARGHPLPAFLLLPVGVYGLAVSHVATAFGPRGSLWGFANGMESGLSLALYAALVALLVRPGFGRSRRHALGAGLLLAALLLARLDNAFLAVALVGVAGARGLARRDAAELRYAILAALPFLATLGAYLAFNRATVGMALPASGVAKAGPPGLDTLGLLAGALADGALLREWRLAQIALPMGMAAVALWVHRRALWGPAPGPLDRVFGVTAVFVLLLGAYDGAVVSLREQGHWYFPISIVFTSHFAFHLLDRPALAGLRTRAAAGAFAAVSAGMFALSFQPNDSFGPALFRKFVVREVPALRRHYGSEPPRLLSYDDGIVAWATGWPALSARGFMLDAEAIDVFRRPDASLLDLAWRRGFDRLTALFYLDARGLRTDSPPRAIRRVLARQLEIPPAELTRFRFAVDYLSDDRRFAILRMEPRPVRPSAARSGRPPAR